MSMIWRPLLLTVLAINLIACQPESAPDTTVTALMSSNSNFTQASPEHRLRFPSDHGTHPDYQIEWWYITANLEDEQGNPFGIQWTLFRQSLDQTQLDGWPSSQFYMAHIAVTTPDNHYFSQKYARGGIGQAGANPSPFAAWIDGWQLASTHESWFPMTLSASGDEFSFEFKLASHHTPFAQGIDGFSAKHSSGVGSHYYSQPFIKLSGQLQLGEKRYQLHGDGWLDREWSSQSLNMKQQGWDWFALHLDHGQKLMVFQLREAKNQYFRYARLMLTSGEQVPITPEQITLEPLSHTSVKGRRLPNRWQLTIENQGIDLNVTMLHPDQWMATDFPYWEGVVEFSGSHKGRGYLEMTGYQSPHADR